MSLTINPYSSNSNNNTKSNNLSFQQKIDFKELIPLDKITLTARKGANADIVELYSLTPDEIAPKKKCIGKVISNKVIGNKETLAIKILGLNEKTAIVTHPISTWKRIFSAEKID